MMMLAQNQQKMYYALLKGEGPIYALDENGNMIIEYVTEEGEIIYRETGENELKYDLPVEFWGNIAMSSGEAQVQEYGVSQADFEAILLTEKGLLPIDETSILWHETEPVIKPEGTSDQYSADYRIIKSSPSLNTDKFVLKAVVK